MNDPTQLDVAALLTEVGVDARTADPSASVGDSSILRSERSVELLPRFDAGTEITLDTLIGEGEVTAVYLGTQKSMRRKVAVRTVHPHRRTPAAPGQVLSAAWMLGAFEHPNILPVYGVAKDPDGLPLVLMKAIETVSWTDILETPGHPLGCPRHTDALEFKVRRMVDVCSALEHAHFRGVIHRDVKPDNVLIGSDGTVYLHGWELAVSLDHDESGRFPRARDQTQIAGTPAYMAPELATRNAGALGVATDVYLAGATLHDAVTGEPRHLGENVFDAFYSAVASTPVDYGDRIPRELAIILNKAMAAEPRSRFESMIELRQALEAFLRHRPSERLTQQAIQAHEEFGRALASGADDFIVRELFATAFTAYGSARHFWSRNPVVTEGLERVLREMIAYEIDHGVASRARDLLSRLGTPAPDLEQRLVGMEDRPTIPRVDTGAAAPPTQPAAAAVLHSGETPRDTRSRLTFMVFMVAVWSAFGIVFGVAEDLLHLQITNLMLVVSSALGWIVLGAVVALFNRSLFKAVAARYVVGPVAAVTTGSTALVITLGLTTPPHTLVVDHFLVFFVAMAMLNALFDSRLVVSSAAYLLAFIVGSFHPEWAFWLMAGSNFVALSFAGVIIHRRIVAAATR